MALSNGVTWPEDKTIDVRLRRTKQDGTVDPTFEVLYTLTGGATALPKNMSGASIARYTMQRTINNNLYTYALDHALAAGYTYYVEEVKSPEGYETRYGTMDGGADVALDGSADRATDGGVIVNKDTRTSIHGSRMNA